MLLLFLPAKSVLALDLDVRSNKSSRLDFALVVDRGNIEVEDGFSGAELDLFRLGIVSIEVPSTGPQFGLLLGYAEVDISNSSSYQTLDMGGYYIGVSVRAFLIRQQPVTLSFYSHYLYQSVDNENDQAKASLTWEEISAELVLAYRLQTLGTLYTGVSGGWLDTRYRYSGTTSTRVDLENKNSSGWMLGFNYQISTLETVGIQYQRSVKEGIQLQFRKMF